MQRQTRKWVRKAEADWRAAHALAAQTPPLRDLACFHCQQAAEKYLKALLQERGAAVPRTHDPEDLLDLLLPHDATLAPQRRRPQSLSRYAVEHRYPDKNATQRQTIAALRQVGRIRAEIRTRLSLEP